MAKKPVARRVQRTPRAAPARHLKRIAAGQLLRDLSAGVLATTGEDFFRAMAAYLGETLEMDCVWIAELSADGREFVTTGVHSRSGRIEIPRCRVAGSACQAVADHGFGAWTRDVRGSFPNDPLLARLNAQSLVGIALTAASGRVVGVLAMFHRQPLAGPGSVQPVLRLFAARAAAEIEHRRAQQALSASEARHRALINAIPDLMFVQDRDGVYLDYHALDRSALLTAPEQFMGRSMHEVLPPELAASVASCITAALETGKTQALEYAVPIGGELRHYDARISPYESDTVLSMIRDVTKRKRSEQTLFNIAKSVSRETGEPFFRALVVNLARALDADCAYVAELVEDSRARARTVAVFADGAVGEDFEYTLADTPCERVVGKEVCAYPSGVQRAFPRDQRLRGLGADGYIGAPLFDSAGRPLGHVVVLWRRPVDDRALAESVLRIVAARAAAELERTRAEQALRESEERLNAVLDNSTAVVYLKDTAGRYLLVNARFAGLMRATKDRLIGKTDYDLFPKERADIYRANDQQVLEARETLEFEESMQHDGSDRVYLSLKFPLFRADGTPYAVCGISTDITQRSRAQERLTHLAHHDSLTGLPNRMLFMDRLQQALIRAHRDGCGVVVMFLDLDEFKRINDTLGHDFGDRLLQVAARLLDGCVRAGDTVARLGGDEFAILLEAMTRVDDIERLADKILNVFRAPIEIDGHRLAITTSIGISRYPDDGRDGATLLRNADAAMYRAKELGRNIFRFC